MAKRRRNPTTDHTGYWIALAALVVGGVAVAAYKSMTPKQQATALQ